MISILKSSERNRTSGDLDRQVKDMIETIIKGIILAVVLGAVWYLVGLVVTALAWPAVVTLIVGVLLALGFLLWVLKAFGINF